MRTDAHAPKVPHGFIAVARPAPERRGQDAQQAPRRGQAAPVLAALHPVGYESQFGLSDGGFRMANRPIFARISGTWEHNRVYGTKNN